MHKLQLIKTTAATGEMISLAGRKLEFKAASERADASELYVFNDGPDVFGVVNGETKQHYSVLLKTVSGQLCASCECPDYLYRKRVCKHIAAVISESLFG